MTFCPGKKQSDALTGAWVRDLEKDLKRIVGYGATHLVTLLEQQELVSLGVESLGSQARRLGLHWCYLSMSDGGIPDGNFADLWKSIGKELRWALLNGDTIVIHCKGGLGRTGTIAAQLLLEFGLDPETAIKQVRLARPGAIENRQQEMYIKHYSPPVNSPEESSSEFAVCHWELASLEAKGLGDIGFPVPLGLLEDMVAAGGRLPFEITIGTCLAWMQEYVAHDHVYWRDFEQPMFRLASRIAGENPLESVDYESSECWVRCQPVDLGQEIVTIQRQGNLLAAFAPTPDGRLTAMALRCLDTEALEYFTRCAIHPVEGQVAMRENNWEYLKDCSAGMGNSYASDRGASYLSYWKHGLGFFDDGIEKLSWVRQRDQKGLPGSVLATQLSVHSGIIDRDIDT